MHTWTSTMFISNPIQTMINRVFFKNSILISYYLQRGSPIEIRDALKFSVHTYLRRTSEPLLTWNIFSRPNGLMILAEILVKPTPARSCLTKSKNCFPDRSPSTVLVGETGIKDVKTSNSDPCRRVVSSTNVRGGGDEFNAFLRECFGYCCYYVVGKNCADARKK